VDGKGTQFYVVDDVNYLVVETKKGRKLDHS